MNREPSNRDLLIEKHLKSEPPKIALENLEDSAEELFSSEMAP